MLAARPPPEGERLPPPPLEMLAVEGNIIFRIRINRPQGTLHRKHSGLFVSACEALTFIESELCTAAYLQSDVLERSSVSLNPLRMRALSDHSWMVLLLLHKARSPPPVSAPQSTLDLFSDLGARDHNSVFHFSIASAREMVASSFAYWS
jgi:hypothetical protein